ncbi:MAG: hypothetical protein LBQ74_03920 [Prevotella sp.]|jgi:hypothetical protein|nr:hypothetical protein [Prevotella sp.]
MKNCRQGLENLIIRAIGLAVAIFLLIGCKSPQQNTEHSTVAKDERYDSLSRIEKTNARLLKVPLSSASLNLNFKNLSDLPIGAKYTEKQGQATVSVEKTGDSDYMITATCDSLTELIIERETEIYHLQNKVRELEDITSTERVEIINETTPIRWFWIYSGYVLWALFGLGGIYLILRWKKKLPF